MELSSLSASAVNVLGRHGICTREEALKVDALSLLARERNCGRKTIEEVARWMTCDDSECVGSKDENARKVA
jgi:hypothetical protein